jgi:hypothetical protein
MTNNKQQSSVEWLIEKCACADLRPELWEIIKQQANAMHKEEIINSFFEGAYGGDNISGEQYYNETYGEL